VYVKYDIRLPDLVVCLAEIQKSYLLWVFTPSTDQHRDNYLITHTMTTHRSLAASNCEQSDDRNMTKVVKHLLVGLSPRMSAFSTRPFYVRTVVNKVAVRQVFLGVLRFSLIFQPMFHIASILIQSPLTVYSLATNTVVKKRTWK
jgi:hypothetical protein